MGATSTQRGPRLRKLVVACLAGASVIALVHWKVDGLLRDPSVCVFGAAICIAGWYYMRNWIELGSPPHVGWDPTMGITWWQDSGFRTPEEFLRFGRSIAQPVNAVHHGFWDGIYSTLWADGYLTSRVHFQGRPPWNYGFMLAGTLLAIVPSALLLIGAGHAVWRPCTSLQRCAIFSLICLATYVVAIIYYSLQIPNYSITKASYTMGLASCYGILIAAGHDTVSRLPGLRPVIWALLVPWAVSAWAAFLVVGT